MKLQIKMNGNILKSDTNSHDWTLFDNTVDQNDYTIEFWGKGTLSNSYFYNASVLIDNIYIGNSKFIIQDGNNLCTTGENDTIIIQDSIPYTLDKFNNFGMNDITSLNNTSIQKLVNQKYNISLCK